MVQRQCWKALTKIKVCIYVKQLLYYATNLDKEAFKVIVTLREKFQGIQPKQTPPTDMFTVSKGALMNVKKGKNLAIVSTILPLDLCKLYII